jgi:hypothetical protein
MATCGVEVRLGPAVLRTRGSFSHSPPRPLPEGQAFVALRQPRTADLVEFTLLSLYRQLARLVTNTRCRVVSAARVTWKKNPRTGPCTRALHVTNGQGVRAWLMRYGRGPRRIDAGGGEMAVVCRFVTHPAPPAVESIGARWRVRFPCLVLTLVHSRNQRSGE